MSTAHVTGHGSRPARVSRVPELHRQHQTHSGGPAEDAHGKPLKSALRKAGILAGTVARVTILGRDGVDL